LRLLRLATTSAEVAFVVAGVSIYIDPHGDFARVSWLIAAALAAKTMIQAGVNLATKLSQGSL